MEKIVGGTADDDEGVTVAGPTTAQLNEIEAELPVIWKRLVAHAERILRSKRWVRGRVPPHGRQALDLLNDVLEKVLTGERALRPGITLEKTIVSGMESVAWSWATGLMNREEGIDAHRADARLGGDDNRPDLQDPESMYLSSECFTTLADMAIEATADDPDAEKLVTAALDGYERPQEVAAVTGLTTAQISNAKKRLHRRLADRWAAEKAKS